MASVLFILGIRGLSHPRTARQGNMLAAIGMGIAVVATLLDEEIENYGLIAVGIAIGTVIGAVSARAVKMTAMPQMVALFNGVGGGAVALVALSEYHELIPAPGDIALETLIPTLLSCVIGAVSFSGSLIAFAKLQELMTGRPIVFPGNQFVNGGLLLGILFLVVLPRRRPRERGPVRADALRALAVRGPADHPGRRRRHAGRDLDAERVHRPVGRRRRLRARQHRADHRRLAGRAPRERC